MQTVITVDKQMRIYAKKQTERSRKESCVLEGEKNRSSESRPHSGSPPDAPNRGARPTPTHTGGLHSTEEPTVHAHAQSPALDHIPPGAYRGPISQPGLGH
ncbi:hypothetical protein DPEC_G00336800 [Dallia pectoralis]|uniref:Uncharacterized protein n=1 Tax=Dallia pectoralis TaxID=75939 RepID=A0ACC2F7C5_DALPE|nr:hypothetical protein DPEC_G00336800 [Dallia pectoralis]